ncbi:MAG: Gfo/Idh/MocA family oxidoreductase [Planctomycetaceae bacterium]|nr:Gfo/Idh/MocA family oxidoreductase [Planctomycetaceae bacterium]
MFTLRRLSFSTVLGVACQFAGWSSAAEPMKVGIIGLDTSHVVAFTTAIQKASAESPLSRLKVVAAFPGGSPDVESSHTRVEGFTETLREQGVEIVDSIEALLPKVDAVLLESVDGRPHLAQATPVFEANRNAKVKKPLFIDKPIAASLADTLKIFRLAEETGTPCFSSSSLRYYPGIVAVNAEQKFGDVVGCVAFSPCSLEEHHPDLYWYGVHGVEILFTIMGPGCESVTCTATSDTHVVTGVWKDGRVGTFRGIRSGKTGYGALIFGTKANGQAEDRKGGYEPLLLEVAKFFTTGKPPVAPEVTTEIMAFMEAADESKRLEGKRVSIAELMKKAKVAAKSN